MTSRTGPSPGRARQLGAMSWGHPLHDCSAWSAVCTALETSLAMGASGVATMPRAIATPQLAFCQFQLLTMSAAVQESKTEIGTARSFAVLRYCWSAR